jgi:hypothetical protein
LLFYLRLPDSGLSLLGGKRHHGHRVALEVVAKFAPRQDDGIQQLLDLRVANLGLREYLTDEVDWSLNEQGMSFLCPLDN